MKINKERRQHQKKNRRKAERRMTRRPLAVCFNSCVWCTLLNVKTVMGIREIGSSLPACLSCNFLVCDYYLTNVIGSGQKRHILSAIFLKPLESKDNKCEDDTNSATSTCLCCLKNSSAFISVRQMGSAFQLNILPYSLFPSLLASHNFFFLLLLSFLLSPPPPPPFIPSPHSALREFVFFLPPPAIPVSFFS